MDIVTVSAIVFSIFAVLDVMAFVFLWYYSRQVPYVRSLRERRNVAFAIMVEVLVVVFLSFNSRYFQWITDRNVTIAILIVGIALPSMVNVVWLYRVLKAVVHRDPAFIEGPDSGTEHDENTDRESGR